MIFQYGLEMNPKQNNSPRIPEENQRVKITVTDAPLVYFKIIYAFRKGWD